ncbi:MAG: peptidoglycan DD-metalloendopeptidase family protein [Gammaproteobacteria bacterium]|nr:peptidoglycan DD-metalloendopeptidase family protein [Gammaproteobacteria bacterium]MBU1554510.1 peptidoglycan DD-metalloendopeptidase family protein [Gammaproteobacteria bacterium]MBU2071969.1 peptidoglycan DD-metalloendopeptidase family protein [Gammaproteobacteria bacterium]MBU2181830.1 peptidoglycan DD-metalloendopeptidase family protein [Gammaproteobacteria bacterium]MBU2204331.1 peptidoglycan DD-metalloendopeptidase family protein [Gammaproteobacteria bacterium]
MKDRIIISVSTINGTRHFNISKLFKRNAIIALWLLLFGLVITAGVIDYLLRSVEKSQLQRQHLSQQATTLRQEISLLQSSKSELEQELNFKQDEMLRVVNRVGEIELALGLEQQYPQDLENRLDTASVNSVARQTMLQLVPNGSPLEFSRRSSRFGLRSHPIVGKQQHHKGVDLSANRGTPIYAPADGVVEVVRPNKQGYGNLLKIRHAFGFSTLYAHLDEFKVKSGHFVYKGELIATSGNTGLSTAPHLHYEVHFLDRALNPQNFMDWDASNFDLVFEKERSIKWDSLVSMLETKASTQLLLSSHKDVQLTATSD